MASLTKAIEELCSNPGVDPGSHRVEAVYRYDHERGGPTVTLHCPVCEREMLFEVPAESGHDRMLRHLTAAETIRLATLEGRESDSLVHSLLVNMVVAALQSESPERLPGIPTTEPIDPRGASHMATLARLYCESKTFVGEDYDDAGNLTGCQMHDVILKPVSKFTGPNRDDEDDDSVFGRATPLGLVQLVMTDAAATMFEPGQKYAVTFETLDENVIRTGAVESHPLENGGSISRRAPLHDPNE